MKIIFTKHAERDKLPLLKELGWNITKTKIIETINNPNWRGLARNNQKTSMSLVDKKHILRVVFRQEGDIIIVITLHIARRGKYGSKL